MRTIYAPNYPNIFTANFEKKHSFIHTYIHFQPFTANLLMIYSFCGMEPQHKFINSLRSSTIAILQLNSISNTLKPALNFQTQQYTKVEDKIGSDNYLLQTNKSEKFSELYLCSSQVTDKENTIQSSLLPEENLCQNFRAF